MKQKPSILYTMNDDGRPDCMFEEHIAMKIIYIDW